MEGTKCKIISKGRVHFSIMICGDPLKKKQIHIFKRLLASNCIYLMNKKPAIFISMLDVNSTFLLETLFYQKAVLRHIDICVVPRIQSPSGLAGTRNDQQQKTAFGKGKRSGKLEFSDFPLCLNCRGVGKVSFSDIERTGLKGKY